MRTDTVAIGATSYLLAQGQNVTELEQAVVSALRAGGEIVQFTEVGNRSIRIAVSPGVAVVFESVERDDDDRDDGNLQAPYDPDSAQYDPDSAHYDPDSAHYELGSLG